MEILSYIIHAYLYITLYEFMIGERKRYIRILFIAALAGVKYGMEYLLYFQQFIPLIVITLLLFYGISARTTKSYGFSLKAAIITYGISLAVNTMIICTTGIILVFFNVTDKKQMYGLVGVIRLVLIAIFIKFSYIVEKIQAGWAMNIGVIASLVLMFMEQILRVGYIAEQYNFAEIVIACAIIAIAFTVIWLIDHYKMNRLQLVYEEDNRQMSKKLHRVKEVLPMIANCVANMGDVEDENLRDSLKQVCIDYDKELGEMEMSAEFFNTTGVPLVDLLLQSKMVEFGDKGIQLDVYVSTNIQEDLKQGDITEGECMRMLADLIRNAEYAVETECMKMILVMIVRDQKGILWMKIYDSGVPFPEQVLEHFGKRGTTTWGTGNGIADVIDTLRRAQASLEIHTALAEEDIYAKEISICFDGKSRVAVC